MLPLLLWMAAAPGYFAGAAEVDVTPTQLPIIVNCGFAERTATSVNSRLYARSLVISQGHERVALTIVDSCMMPRDLLDRAKALAAKRTGLAPTRMLIAATHTHTAPSVHACLGSGADAAYADFLAGRIADAIAQADERRVPARLAAAAVDMPGYTHSRRFLYRAQHALTDPFGVQNVFANMHPGYQNANAVGPSGPVDPALTVLSVQTRDGAPLAVLANFSMHYFGGTQISADYGGLVTAGLRARLAAHTGTNFVPIFSQGTSGDLHWMDYSKPKTDITIERYAAGLADAAVQAIASLRYQSTGALAMEQTVLTADWRRPDAERLAWARPRAAALAGANPKLQPDIYAREAVLLADKPKAEMILQALRIGDLAVTALPNEVFALTGLKLKKRSPLALTMNLELANGAEGYIPPPEQHALGGYTTWPARTAGLVVDTEPRVVSAMLAMLERVARAPRRRETVTPGAYARGILQARAGAKPAAYWPMEDLEGFTAQGRGGALSIEGKHAVYLDGVDGRAAYLLDARLRFPFARPAGDHTLEWWQWSAATRIWQYRADVCQNGQLTRFTGPQAEPAGACGGPLWREAFEGKVDEVAFYRRALPANERQSHEALGAKQ